MPGVAMFDGKAVQTSGSLEWQGNGPALCPFDLRSTSEYLVLTRHDWATVLTTSKKAMTTPRHGEEVKLLEGFDPALDKD